MWEGVVAEYPEAAERLKLSEVIRRIIDYLASSLTENTLKVLKEKGITSVEEVRACSSRLIAMEPEVSRGNLELKAFLLKNLYNHEKFVGGRGKAQGIIRALFKYYLEHPDKLPESRRQRINIQGLPRTVCDYIAGMTDNYAKARAEEI